MGRKFHLAAVVIGAVQINQISQQDISTNIEELLETVDGQVDVSFVAVNEIKPVVTFTSTAIRKVLDAISLINGLAVTSSNIDLYFQSAVNGGTRDTEDCVKLTCTDGLVCIDSIKGTHNKPAEISLTVYATSVDGTTATFSTDSGVTLPAQVATRQYYTMGPVAYSGASFDSVEDWSLNMNKKVDHSTFDGQPYPTLAYIQTRQPVFNVKGSNVTLATQISDGSGNPFVMSQSATDSTLYLRKYAPGGTRVADATAEHIKFTLDDGMIIVRKAGGGSKDAASVDIDIIPAYDGTNPIIAVNTASAIS